MSKRYENLLAGVLFLIVSAVLYYRATAIQNPGFDPLGPAYLPKLALIVTGLCSLLLIAHAVLCFLGLWPERIAGSAPGENESTGRLTAVGAARTGGTVLLLVVYVYVLVAQIVRFEIATTLFLLASGLLLGAARTRLSALILIVASALTAICIGYVFRTQLYVNLP